MSFLFSTPDPLVCNVKNADETQSYQTPNKIAVWIAMVLIILATILLVGLKQMMFGGILYVVAVIIAILASTALKTNENVCVKNPLL